MSSWTRAAVPRRLAVLALAAAFAVAIAYAAASPGSSDGRALRAAPESTGVGVSVDVPPGWDGRTLFLGPTDDFGAILQVASFELPADDGFSSPAKLAPGDEDPITAMGEGDVLITLVTGTAGGTPAPVELSLDHLEPVSGARVPRGHALWRGTFCWDSRCLATHVDFGGRPVEELATEVDAVLASISVVAGRS